MSVYGYKVIVPVLVVPGQADDMILGNNAIKWLISQVEDTAKVQTVTSSASNAQDNLPQLLSVLSSSNDREGGTVSHRIGTAKLKRCVNLQPMSEHLVWAKLGSTVIIEPTQSKCRPAQILSLPYGVMAGFQSK